MKFYLQSQISRSRIKCDDLLIFNLTLILLTLDDAELHSLQKELLTTSLND